LSTRDTLFKAPASLVELKKINTGLYYGFSQVGKFITIYPRCPDEALVIARKVDEATRGLACPRVPFDKPLRNDSCVFYRYGAFRSPPIRGDADEQYPQWLIRRPDGQLIPDSRTREAAVPEWATDPFLLRQDTANGPDAGATLLKTRYRAYAAISQRGKGGVYKAIDLRFAPARHCTVKEGRRNGETDWDGTDGYSRLENERRMLERLASCRVPVPAIIDYFIVDRSNYLILESVQGETLHELVTQKRKLPVPTILRQGARVAELLHSVHEAGIIWRDCKPLNIIIDEWNTLRPIDFEGACVEDDLPAEPWGTYGYTPPDWLEHRNARDLRSEDLYALGATLHHMFSGRPPVFSELLPPIGALRRGIPADVRRIISLLTSAAPDSRPSASVVAAKLAAAAGPGS
jgi:hypothetical protein